MNAEGGAAALWGGTESKKKKKGRRRAWACLQTGLGRFDPWSLGRVERGYIRIERPIFFHFPLFFLSLLLSRERSSLLSPKAAPAASSSPAEKWVVGGRSDAAVGRHWRRRRRTNPLFFCFFFRAYSSTPSSLFISGLKTSKIFIKRPRSKKERKKIYTFIVFWFWLSLCFSLWWLCATLVCVCLAWEVAWVWFRFGLVLKLLDLWLWIVMCGCVGLLCIFVLCWLFFFCRFYDWGNLWLLVCFFSIFSSPSGCIYGCIYRGGDLGHQGIRREWQPVLGWNWQIKKTLNDKR